MTGSTEKPLTKNMRPDGSVVDLKAYEQAGGYQGIHKVLNRGMAPRAVADEVKNANLRGRGGAGFPTGTKWSFVPLGKDVPNPTYLVVNADEMEPGSFKDRPLLERDPHQLIEGAILDAKAVEDQLATMPGKNELRAKLLATLQAPLQQFVALLQAPTQNFVYALAAKERQG